MPQALRYLVQRSVFGLFAIAAACSDDAKSASPPDSGSGANDAGRDAGGSGVNDAGGKAGGKDAGASGAGADGGRKDAGTSDAGRDAGTVPATDSGTDAGPQTASPWSALPSRMVTASAPPTGAANATGQTPMFATQTRAPAPASLSKVKVQTITEGLASPWAVEALRDGRFVVTEKGGTLRVVNLEGKKLAPIAGMPAVDSGGQGGLLDVAIDEATTPMTLCITYAKPRGNGTNSTAADCTTATGTDNLTVEPLKAVFQQEPAWASGLHFGSRFVFAANDLVYITMGERSLPESRGYAQDTSKTLGKVVRLRRDGTPPSDNPFAADGGPAAQVWSYGHRNLQSAALDTQGRLWTVEHGPRGGDELNLPLAGKNYGWPTITYGEDYSGAPIGAGITSQDGMEQPVYFWDPVIAPSGMVVYSGNLFGEWRGDILIGGLVAQAVVHLKLEGDRVVSEERIGVGARVRDVTQGPDGAIYIVTDEGNGKLLRLTPG